MGAPTRKPPMTKETWRAFAARLTLQPPPLLTAAQFMRMGDVERVSYRTACLAHNAQLGPYALGNHAAIVDAVDDLCEANERLPDDAIRRGAAIDGLPNLGKSTLLRVIGRRHDRKMRDLWGWETDAGDEYWPTCHICLPSGTSIRGLNGKLMRFFDLVKRDKEPLDSSTERVIDALQRAGTSLVLIDDLHYIKPHQLKGQALNDHLKHLMNEVAATFVFAGVGLLEAGIYREGKGMKTRQFAQLARRLRHLPVTLLTSDDENWRKLLAAFQTDVRLLAPASLTSPVMSEYLYGRSGGSLGDVADLVRLAAEKALKHDTANPERARGLTLEVFEAVTLSQGAEEGRPPVGARRRRSPARKSVTV